MRLPLSLSSATRLPLLAVFLHFFGDLILLPRPFLQPFCPQYPWAYCRLILASGIHQLLKPIQLHLIAAVLPEYIPQPVTHATPPPPVVPRGLGFTRLNDAIAFGTPAAYIGDSTNTHTVFSEPATNAPCDYERYLIRSRDLAFPDYNQEIPDHITSETPFLLFRFCFRAII